MKFNVGKDLQRRYTLGRLRSGLEALGRPTSQLALRAVSKATSSLGLRGARSSIGDKQTSNDGFGLEHAQLKSRWTAGKENREMDTEGRGE